MTESGNLGKMILLSTECFLCSRPLMPESVSTALHSVFGVL